MEWKNGQAVPYPDEDFQQRYLITPLGVAIDRQDRLWVIDHGMHGFKWADALSFGPQGWLYVADSAIPQQMLQSKSYITAAGPYYIFRFKPGNLGIPGQ